MSSPRLSLNRCLFSALTTLVLPGCAPLKAATLPAGFSETKIAEGLNPTTMEFAPDGRLFLCEKQGLLRVVTGDKLLEKPVLDLTKQVDSWNERGLLSVCFDPEFARNGWIYLYYTHLRKPDDASHTSSNNRVSRFTVTSNAADPGSEKVILELNDLSKVGWHNGGGLAFGKDGKLYVSTGENAVGPNAQNPGNLLGKLLRINKDGTIPTDNPYYGKFEGKNRAIVALGLRNAFAISVQPGSGLLYLSMVGANFEQIERYDTGKRPEAVNYGWPEIDGPPKQQKQPEGYRAPEYAYDHGKGKGVALCGGDFYNPAKPGPGAFPATFTGKFFFSDYGGWIKLIDPAKPGERQDFAHGINRPIDVATAPDGGLWYIERAGIPGGSDASNSASTNGALWRVTWTGERASANLASKDQPKPASSGSEFNLPPTAEGALPATLAATGLFSDNRLSPKAGVVPYSLNGTAWADGAKIRRWVALPKSGKVGFAPNGEWQWPGGTVLVQHFDLPRPGQTGALRPLETRVLVLDGTGTFGYGLTYRWREDGSGADLVAEGGREESVATTDSGGVARQQTWSYPGRGACYLCHTPNAGFVLGPKTHQLNGPHTYPGARTDNQLRTWNYLQMFREPLNEATIASLPRAVALDAPGASPQDRFHSYLDTNCAQCHRPAGTGALWDARFGTPLAKQDIIGGAVRNNLGIEDAKLIAPHNVAKSLMHHRMSSTNPTTQMPPFTRNVPDKAALAVLEEWIRSLP